MRPLVEKHLTDTQQCALTTLRTSSCGFLVGGARFSARISFGSFYFPNAVPMKRDFLLDLTMCASLRFTPLYANLSLDPPLSCGGATFCSFISRADRTARPTDSDRPSFPGSAGPRAILTELMAA